MRSLITAIIRNLLPPFMKPQKYPFKKKKKKKEKENYSLILQFGFSQWPVYKNKLDVQDKREVMAMALGCM